tara:strand:- start:2086 stop:2280 length:195 start_codon:yes stop_codon:yes gene_type:complete
MNVGDLVVCNCESDAWYKGMTGTLVGFDLHGNFNPTKGDPLVMYGNGETIRLAGTALEVINESR